jgi:hypothetical protein
MPAPEVTGIAVVSIMKFRIWRKKLFWLVYQFLRDVISYHFQAPSRKVDTYAPVEVYGSESISAMPVKPGVALIVGRDTASPMN